MSAQPSDFVSKTGAYLSGSFIYDPYPKTFSKDVKVCRDKRSSLSLTKNFIDVDYFLSFLLRPRAIVIKLLRT